MPMNAPMSATGTTSVGISVARKLCRNTSITMNTSTTAMISVMMTSWMAVVMNMVASNGDEPLDARAGSCATARPCAP